MAPHETCPPASSSVQSSVLFLFLVVSGLFCACAWASPQGGPGLQEIISKAALEKNIEIDHQSQFFDDADHLHLEDNSQEPCYPAVFSRNMSSLLKEASNMLDRVQDTNERTWLKAFIQRLSYLADDLQKHPGIKRPECNQLLTSPSAGPKEVTNQSPDGSSLLHDTAHSSHVPGPAGEAYASTKPSVGPEADDLEHQLRSGPPRVTTFEPKPFREHPHGMIDVRVWTPTVQSSEESKSVALDAAPDANRQKLLGEISSQVQRLRELGGTERDILSLWKQSDSSTDPKGINTSGLRPEDLDFEDEEQGAALGELDPSWTQTSAPFLIDVRSTAGPLPVTAPHDQDDADDLVRQLQAQKTANSAWEAAKSRVGFQAPRPY